MDTIHPRKMEGAKQMSQQCGKCKWWDYWNSKAVMGSVPITLKSTCKAPVPKSLIIKIKLKTKYEQGQNCPVYEERKECEE